MRDDTKLTQMTDRTIIDIIPLATAPCIADCDREFMLCGCLYYNEPIPGTDEPSCHFWLIERDVRHPDSVLQFGERFTDFWTAIVNALPFLAEPDKRSDKAIKIEFIRTATANAALYGLYAPPTAKER